MVRESQTPRVTQIQVRVDCNGCVQKIKKALRGINGIQDLRVDFHRQKLTIIGWADPEKVVKAIKKTRKNAIICSNIELPSPSKPTEPEPEPEPKGNGSAPDATQPRPAEAPSAQANPPTEPPPEATPSPTPTQHNASQQRQNNPGTKSVGQVHMMQHHRPNYVNKFSSGHSYVDHRDRCHDTPVFLHEPSQPMYVTHSYNTHMPSHYVTEYEYVSSPSWQTHYNRSEHYSEDYQDGNVNIRSMFSDDNPNACSIV